VKPQAFTNNRDAALAFQSGRYFLSQGDPDKALTNCEKAIDLDPGFAAAYACAARALLQQPEMDAADLQKARSLVARAASLERRCRGVPVAQGPAGHVLRLGLRRRRRRVQGFAAPQSG